MATARTIPEIIFYTGDKRPVITGTLYESSGAVYNLTGATSVDLLIYLEGSSTVWNAGSTGGTIASPTAGSVTYTLSNAFTDEGSYIGQWKITWSGSLSQHSSEFRIRVKKGA